MTRADRYRARATTLTNEGLEDCAVAGRMLVDGQISGSLDLQLRAQALNDVGESKLARGAALFAQANSIDREGTDLRRAFGRHLPFMSNRGAA